jgi:hypothetical protein
MTRKVNYHADPDWYYCGDVSAEYGGIWIRHYGDYCDAYEITDLDSACGFRGAIIIENKSACISRRNLKKQGADQARLGLLRPNHRRSSWPADRSAPRLDLVRLDRLRLLRQRVERDAVANIEGDEFEKFLPFGMGWPRARSRPVWMSASIRFGSTSAKRPFASHAATSPERM